jgi:hypothetical protein
MSRHSSSTGRLGLELLRGALDSLLPGFGGDHLGLPALHLLDERSVL